MALFAREFEDVLYFTRPLRLVQRDLFAVLAPVALLLGYRGSYHGYTSRSLSERVEVEPWPGWGGVGGRDVRRTSRPPTPPLR